MRLTIQKSLFLLALSALFALPLSGQGFDDDSPLPVSDPSNFAALESTNLNSLVDQLRAIAAPVGSDDPAPLSSWRSMIEVFERIYAIENFHNFVVPVPDSPSRWVSAVEAVNRVLQILPEPAFRAWSDAFGSKSEVEYEFARQKSATTDLLRLGAVFLYSNGGVLANNWVASQAFESGNLSLAALADLRAVRGLQHLGRTAEAAHHLARAYQALALLGRNASLREAQRRYHELHREKVTSNGAVIALSDLIKELETVVPLTSPDGAVSTVATGLDGYGASGSILTNKEAWAPVNLPTPASEPYSMTRRDGRRGDPFSYMYYYQPEAPQIIPVIHEGVVLVNSGEHLSGIDLFTGRPKWEPVSLPPPPDAFKVNEIDPNLLLSATGWRNRAFAALENPLNYNDHDPKPDARYGYLVPFYPLPKRSLVAVDVANGETLWRLGGHYTTPANIAAATDLERFCSTLSFSHSIVVGETLYAIGELRANQSELLLIAIDPEKGTPLWRVSLCQGQSENNMFGNAAREALPAPPVSRDGIIVVQSNLGGIIAVDVDAQSVRWVRQYDAMPRPYTRRQRTNYRKRTFLNSNPICAELPTGRRLVVSAPTDARAVFCFDLDTGEQEWVVDNIEPPQTRANEMGGPGDPGPSALVGVYRDSVYVARESTLKQLRLSDGKFMKDVGAAVYRSDGRPAMNNPLGGRAALTENRIFWPGRSGLNFFDIADDGELTPIPEILIDPAFLGNMVVREGVLAVVTGNSYLGPRVNDRYTPHPTLTVRFDPRQRLREAEGELRRLPNSLSAKVKVAQLADRLGADSGYVPQQIDELLVEVVRSDATDPKDADARTSARRLLFDRFVARADALSKARDRDGARKALAAAREWTTDSGQLRDLFRLEEDDLIQAKDSAGMMELYERTIASDASFTLTYRGTQVSVGHYAREKLVNALIILQRAHDAVEHAHWLESYFLDLGATQDYESLVRRFDLALNTEIGRQSYAAINARAAALLQNAPTLREKLNIARRFPHGPTALAILREALANPSLVSDSNSLGELRDTLGLLAERQETAQLWLDLYLRLKASKRRTGAFLALGQLRLMQDYVIEVEGKQQRLSSVLAAAQSLGSEAAQRAAAFEMLPFSGKPAWSQTAKPVFGPNTQAPSLRTAEQNATHGDQVYLTGIYTDAGTGMMAFDATSGERQWVSEGTFGYYGTFETETTVVAVDGSNVTGLSRDNGKLMWRIPLGGYYRSMAWRDGLLVIAFQISRDFTNLYVVSGIDCEEGRVAWSVEYPQEAIYTNYTAFTATEVVLTDRLGQRISLIDIATGKETTLTRESTSVMQLQNTPVVAAGKVWFTGFDRISRKMMATTLDLTTRAFSADIHLTIPNVQQVSAAGDYVVYCNHLGALEVFDARSGESRWNYAGNPERYTLRCVVSETHVGVLTAPPHGGKNSREVWLSLFSLQDGRMLSDKVVVSAQPASEDEQVFNVVVDLTLADDSALVVAVPSIGIPVPDGRGGKVQRSGEVSMKVIRLSDATIVSEKKLTEGYGDPINQIFSLRVPGGLLVCFGGEARYFSSQSGN